MESISALLKVCARFACFPLRACGISLARRVDTEERVEKEGRVEKELDASMIAAAASVKLSTQQKSTSHSYTGAICGQ